MTKTIKKMAAVLLAVVMAAALMPVLNAQVVHADETAGTIQNLAISVTPPAAGQKTSEVRPQVSIDGENVSLESTSWMEDLNTYSSTEPDIIFDEGAKYYILALVKADNGWYFEKGSVEYTGNDDGFRIFEGAAVTGGNLEFAASQTFDGVDYLRVKISVRPTPAISDVCPAGGEHAWNIINHKATFEGFGFQEAICTKCGQDGGMAVGALPVKTVKLAKTSCVYTGKPIKPAVSLANGDGPLSAEYYTLTYSNNTNVGTANVKITLTGEWFEGTKTLTFKITPAANPLTAKGKTATVKFKKLKKKAQSLPVTKVITFTKKGQGPMAYTKASGDKKITINKKTGKVTVKKGLKKGTYKVTVKIKAAGNKNYKASAEKKVTFKIKVK